MKMTRKILPALAMLIVSAVMTTTASFAWFAMSTEVDASGMTATVKSDSVALVIRPVANIDTVWTADQVRADDYRLTSVTGIAIGETELLPAAYENISNGGDLATATNWYTAKGNDTNDPSLKDGTKVNLETANFGQYVLRYKYYVTLSEGSNSIDSLRIKDLSLTVGTAKGSTQSIEPVRVIVACGSVHQEFAVAGASGAVGTAAIKTGKSDANLLSNGVNGGTLTSASVAEIIVYVYYDGNDAKTTTENLVELDGVNITFTLTSET